MPSSIPYDPSLVLGNIVHKEVLDRVIAVSNAQAKADEAQSRLNQELALKRSLDMTLVELTSMQQFSPDALVNKHKENPETAQTAKLRGKIAEVKKRVFQFANDFADAKTNSLIEIAEINAKAPSRGSNGIGMVQAEMESPVDYGKTSIKKMPLATDSIKMDCQYFSYEKNEQSSKTMASTIKSFVEASASGALSSNSISMKAAHTAADQANAQYENHDTIGTLVISISCTHKDATLLTPLKIDPNKGIDCWNQVHADDRLDTSDPREVAKLAIGTTGQKSQSKAIHLISGASYGSSFVAMVHVLNNSETNSHENMFDIADQVTGMASRGWLFSKVKVGAGLDDSYDSSVKALLSTQNIQTHCNIVTMGNIPTIKSNEVKMAVKEFIKFSPADAMGKLAQLQNAGAQAIDSAKLSNFEATKIQNVLSGVQKNDDGLNKILDVNSVMNAMENYVDNIQKGDVGVPINYYLKAITKQNLAKMWIDENYPFYFSDYLSRAKVGTKGRSNGSPNGGYPPSSNGNGTTTTTSNATSDQESATEAADA